MVPNASAYWLSQSARVGWFLGQYLLTNQLSRRRATGVAAAGDREAVTEAEPYVRPVRMPTLAELLDDIGTLMKRDWRNIRDGLYAAPAGLADPGEALADALRYFRDFPEVDARRHRRGHDEVRRGASTPLRGLPDYYLRNFHYQTDGYLSERSARLYDHQVEVLFIGSAETMRRQALVPIGAFARRHSRRAPIAHLDVACGTGSFLETLLDNMPYMRSVGLDLSPYYLAEAERKLGPRPGLSLVRGLAEELPVADGSLDLVTCVYLLHEVPPEVRARIANEFTRVLRPGGRLVLVDSLQMGDRPAWDGLLAAFPHTFHEPFYEDYAHSDLRALFAEAGLKPVSDELAFLSKIMVFDKPAG